MNGAVAVDASVLVAILGAEPEAYALAQVVAHHDLVIGAPTLFEVSLWSVKNLATAQPPAMHTLLSRMSTSVVPFDRELEAIAAEAYARFGKGRHRAKLNYGDCMAYAVSRARGLPLLFKGDDFQHTDVKVHPASVLLQDVL